MPESLRIALLEPTGYSPESHAHYAAHGDLIEGPFTRADLLAGAADAEVWVIRLGHRFDAELLAQAPRLRVIVSPTTGLDHIDLEQCRARGIAVLSLQGEQEFLRSVRATVEHTLALALTLLRRTHRASAHVAEGGWDRDRFRGRELARKRLGLVGLGRIGSAVAELGRAFAMHVTAHDPYLEAWPSGVARTSDLPSLLAQSDVLSVHVPLDETTRGLIGFAELAALPPGAVLINTSRGAVVDESALLDALRAGHLGGAALDVLVGEGQGAVRADHPLVQYARTHDTLVITPHIGGATYESMAQTEVFMAQKLARWLTGSDTDQAGVGSE